MRILHAYSLLRYLATVGIIFHDLLIGQSVYNYSTDFLPHDVNILIHSMPPRPSPAAPPRKRLGRPPAVSNPRARILAAAAALFSERGYETSSLAELAAAMKISKAAIYHYFSTKQDIYDALILETLEGLSGAVEAAVAGETQGGARLRAFMLGHARFFEQHRAGFIAMLVGFSGMTNSQFHAEAMQLRDGHERLLRSIIAAGVADGSFRQLDPVTTTRAVLSLLNWMVRWFHPGAGMSAEQIALDYYELLVQGMLPSSQPALKDSDHGS